MSDVRLDLQQVPAAGSAAAVAARPRPERQPCMTPRTGTLPATPASRPS